LASHAARQISEHHSSLANKLLISHGILPVGPATGGNIGLRATAHRNFAALSVPTPRAGRVLTEPEFQFLDDAADNE
jgi:hypothetical protein